MRVSVTQFVGAHALALSISLLVGLSTVAPHFLAARALGSEYQGFPFIYQDDEDIYMARAQEIIDGHLSVGSPMLYEYKNNWPTVPAGPEYVYALPSILFGTSLASTIVVAKFALPALLFFLIYLLVLQLASSRESFLTRLSAITAALCATMGYDMVDYSQLPQLLQGAHLQLSVWTRPVNPIGGGLLLFTLLLILAKIFTTQKRWLFVPAGLVLGVMITYFFSWFLGLAMTGLLLLLSLYYKRYDNAKQYGFIIGTSAIIQLPYWYHTLTATHDERLSDMLRNGANLTHAPIINKFLLAGSILYIIGLLFYKRVSHEGRPVLWVWFTGFLLLGSWVAFNQQVITGISVWPYHFVQYTIPFVFVTLFVLGMHIAPRAPRTYTAALFLLCAVVGVLGFESARSSRYQLEDFAHRQTFMPLFAALNEAPKDCVVLVDEPEEVVTRLIPAMTHCNTYISDYVFFGVPEKRVLHNFLVLLRLNGVTPTEARVYLTEHPKLINRYFFKNYEQVLSGTTTPETLASQELILAAYPDFYQKDFLNELKRYRIDYIVTPRPKEIEAVAPRATWPRAVQYGELYLLPIPR